MFLQQKRQLALLVPFKDSFLFSNFDPLEDFPCHFHIHITVSILSYLHAGLSSGLFSLVIVNLEASNMKLKNAFPAFPYLFSIWPE